MDRSRRGLGRARQEPGRLRSIEFHYDFLDEVLVHLEANRQRPRYSNLIGSGDGETGDENALTITFHRDGWADRVHEGMPRVRFGDVRVFNNYYSSSGNDYCIRAGYHSKVLVENNHFQGVGKPHEIGEDSGTAEVVALGNTYTSKSGARDTRGTAFTPPYTYTLDDASSVASAVQSGAAPH